MKRDAPADLSDGGMRQTIKEAKAAGIATWQAALNNADRRADQIARFAADSMKGSLLWNLSELFEEAQQLKEFRHALVRYLLKNNAEW